MTHRADNPEQLEKIKLVIEEKERLKECCNSLSHELSEYTQEFILKELGRRYKMTTQTVRDEEQKAKRDKIDRLMIDLANHLSIIAGFCNSESRNRIYHAKLLLVEATQNPLVLSRLRYVLPFIAGLEVDFNKSPFKVIEFDIGKFLRFKGKR